MTALLSHLRERVKDAPGRDFIEETAAYAVICDATEAHVVVFDRRGIVGWDERVFTDSGESGGVKIKIWGM